MHPSGHVNAPIRRRVVDLSRIARRLMLLLSTPSFSRWRFEKRQVQAEETRVVLATLSLSLFQRRCSLKFQQARTPNIASRFPSRARIIETNRRPTPTRNEHVVALILARSLRDRRGPLIPRRILHDVRKKRGGRGPAEQRSIEN